MAKVLTIGEPMALLVANAEGEIKDANGFTRYVCGSEVNFSIGMARLGHEISYISKVGNDPFGLHIRDFFTENGIDNSFVSLDDVNRTGMQLKSKTSVGDPVVVNFRRFTAFSYFSEADVATINWDGVDHLHVTGIPPALSESCRKASFAIIAEAKKRGVKISFDTNLRPALWESEEAMKETVNALAAQSDLVLPGLGEGQRLTGLQTAEEIADFYLKSGAKAVVIKLGTDGAYVNNGETSFHVPAYVVEQVVDTVGAGDGFAVGCVSGLLEGLAWEDAVRRGAAIGALAVMAEGDNEGLPTREQLNDFQNK